jgi:6-phosphogluconate dehydrogenase (decarboxylating)
MQLGMIGLGRMGGNMAKRLEQHGHELKIPDRPFGFGRLIRAQAAGDFESLRERDRRVARIHVDNL